MRKYCAAWCDARIAGFKVLVCYWLGLVWAWTLGLDASVKSRSEK